MASPDVDFTVVNPAIASGNQAVIYQNVSATLNLTLTNNTGGDITFHAGRGASNFQIYMPEYFTDAQLQAMTITPPAYWRPSYNAGDPSWMLTFAGSDGNQDGTVWKAGQSVSFSIAAVLASAQPCSNSIQINPANMTGNVPTQIQAALTLCIQPQPGNLDLTKTLQVSLASQGIIFVSEAGDPLPNTLFLNLKNTGSTAIYSGNALWTCKPKVIVTFVYGQTSGALAPDSDKESPQVGSAWNIEAAVDVSQGNDWKVTNPSHTGQDPHPAWVLEPANTNKGIIGTNDGANITFALGKIVSLTPPGHTQMRVLFTGFPADDGHDYDDVVYVLDIFKKELMPHIEYFAANPGTIGLGQSSILSWKVVGADACMIDPGDGSQLKPNDTLEVKPTQTMEYSLTVMKDPQLIANASVTVARPQITKFVVNRTDPIVAGDTVILSWETQFASSCVINQGIGEVGSSGQISVTPRNTTTYTLTCEGFGGPVTQSVTVSVQSVRINSFTVMPAAIVPGQKATLAWDTLYAEGGSIDNGVGTIAVPKGSVDVSPKMDTVFRLTCNGPNGTVSSTVELQVNIPQISFSTNNMNSFSWSTKHATSCEVRFSGVPDFVSHDLSGSSNYFYGGTVSIKCNGPGGSISQNFYAGD